MVRIGSCPQVVANTVPVSLSILNIDEATKVEAAISHKLRLIMHEHRGMSVDRSELTS